MERVYCILSGREAVGIQLKKTLGSVKQHRPKHEKFDYDINYSGSEVAFFGEMNSLPSGTNPINLDSDYKSFRPI